MPRRRKDPTAHPVEIVDVASLKPHPRNYRVHPPDQLQHIAQSLTEHGIYRNVVVTTDSTILAGHGVVEAANLIGMKQLPVIRLALHPDEPKALKVLTADNELGKFAESNERLLSELLKEVSDQDLTGLLGTGYDEAMLATLVMVTRPASEILDFDEAAAWVGLPGYEPEIRPPQLFLAFDSEADRDRCIEQLGIKTIMSRGSRVWSTWWPERKQNDLASLRFDDQKVEPGRATK